MDPDDLLRQALTVIESGGPPRAWQVRQQILTYLAERGQPPQYVYRVTRDGSEELHTFLEEGLARSIASVPGFPTTISRARIGPWERLA